MRIDFQNIKKKVIESLKLILGDRIIYNGLLPKIKICNAIIPFQIKYIFKIPLPIPFWYFSLFDVLENNIKEEHYIIRDKLEDKIIKRKYLEKIFEKKMGFFPNFDKPTTFTEKLNYLKLYYENPLITQCCDKFHVKEYIKKHAGEKYIVPNIGRWNSAEEIKVENLPNKFVLKVNWSSGYNIIVNDKLSIKSYEWNLIKKQINKWLRPESNSYYDSFNWGYKNMIPIVFAEEFLDIGSIHDEYKLFCFNGNVVFSLIEHFDNNGINTRVCIDKNGNKLKFNIGRQPEANCSISKKYFEMIDVATRLSKEFIFVRVDFMELEDKLYVGELTFYSGGGFSKIYPSEYDKKIGTLLNVENI